MKMRFYEVDIEIGVHLSGIGNEDTRKQVFTVRRDTNIVRDRVLNAHNPLFHNKTSHSDDKKKNQRHVAETKRHLPRWSFGNF